ncbi:MAG: hypothetical protein QF535_22460 [Anaerolineales bacterium]|nr:hypothetical protein [Anaerolineales bacterium]
MTTYTQITRNADGEYIRETKDSLTKTFYLVEYSTIGTYYKVEARSLDEAQDRMYNVDDDGVESIENPDRFDVMVDDWLDEKDYNRMKEKLEWRKQVAK